MLKLLDRLHRTINRWRIRRHLAWLKRSRYVSSSPSHLCQRGKTECAGKV